MKRIPRNQQSNHPNYVRFIKKMKYKANIGLEESQSQESRILFHVLQSTKLKSKCAAKNLFDRHTLQTMKISSAFALTFTLPSVAAFTFCSHSPNAKHGTILESMSGRRVFLNTAASVAVSSAFALPSFAEYVPKFDDMKQIVNLGYSLDKLIEKLSNDATVGEALTGLIAFNRDKDFYTTYARNYVGKTVKNNANGDSRVGNVRLASSLIGSCQELLEGRQGLLGKEASDEVRIEWKF